MYVPILFFTVYLTQGFHLKSSTCCIHTYTRVKLSRSLLGTQPRLCGFGPGCYGMGTCRLNRAPVAAITALTDISVAFNCFFIEVICTIFVLNWEIFVAVSYGKAKEKRSTLYCELITPRLLQSDNLTIAHTYFTNYTQQLSLHINFLNRTKHSTVIGSDFKIICQK